MSVIQEEQAGVECVGIQFIFVCFGAGRERRSALRERGEGRLVVERRGSLAGGTRATATASLTTAAGTTTALAASTTATLAATTAAKAAALGALEAGVDLEEDLLLLLSTSLRCRLGLRMVKVNEMCKYEISVESTFPTK